MFDANSMLSHSVKVLAIFDSLAELTLRCFVVHRPRAGAVSVDSVRVSSWKMERVRG
jgi:hypothetical protein